MSVRTVVSDSTSKFDIVIVPRGSVDPKVVVGTVGADDVATVKASKVRSAKRVWRGIGVELLLGSPPRATPTTAPVPANYSLEAQADGLLGQLAITMDTLATAQSAFRADLRAAIAEG